MNLSKNKAKALNQLERAIKACDKAGLVLAGSHGLKAYERKEWENIKHESGDDSGYTSACNGDYVELTASNYEGEFGP